MSIVPDLEPDRLRSRTDVPSSSTLSDIEIPPAQHERECHAAEGRGGRWKGPIFLALNATHYGGHEFAEQNDGEQAESLRKMRSVGWELQAVFRSQPRRPEIDCEGDTPHPISGGCIEQSGDNPDQGCGAESDRISRRKTAGLR